MKRYILLALFFLNYHTMNFGIHKPDVDAIEVAMRGRLRSIFFRIMNVITMDQWARTYSYSVVQRQSTEKKIELWQDELGTYYELIDNALKRVNQKRNALKKEVDGITASDFYLTGRSFGQIFFDMFNCLRIFFKGKSHNTTIDAYNHLTAMKNRLEKLVDDRMEKRRREEVALVFKKQNIYLNKCMQNEDIPKELIQKHIIPVLLNDSLHTSPKDIALLAYWSDGVANGWLESSPPKGTIYIGLKAHALCGGMSDVLYNIDNNFL